MRSKNSQTSKEAVLLFISIIDTARIVKKQNNETNKYKNVPCLQLFHSDWLNSTFWAIST